MRCFMFFVTIQAFLALHLVVAAQRNCLEWRPDNSSGFSNRITFHSICAVKRIGDCFERGITASGGLSSYYRELGNLPAAEMCYLNLLNARETGHIDSLDITMATYKAHHNLALIYQDMERLPEAQSQWEAAIASNPTFAPSLMGLAELYLHLRRFDDVCAIIARLEPFAPDQAAVLQRLAQTRG